MDGVLGIDAGGYEPLPAVEQYLEGLPPAQAGHWREFFADELATPCSSLDFAKSVQQSVRGKDFASQERMIRQNLNQLDALAIDIKDRRVALRMQDGSWLSSDVGGYTVLGESKRCITLRLYELAEGIKLAADYDDEGRRRSGPAYAPVLAVVGLARLMRH